MGWGGDPTQQPTQPWQGVGVKFATFWDTPETHSKNWLGVVGYEAMRFAGLQKRTAEVLGISGLG